METVDADFVARVVIGLLVITAPFDPVKLLFFNQVVGDRPQSRTGAALKLSIYVTVILAVAALVGKELLEAMGIDLNVFGAVGGIVIAGMGFEMLYGGGAPKAQGEAEREQGPEEGDGLLIPLAIPLIAGPGAITTTITFSSQNTSSDGLVARRSPSPRSLSSPSSSTASSATSSPGSSRRPSRSWPGSAACCSPRSGSRCS